MSRVAITEDRIWAGGLTARLGCVFCRCALAGLPATQ